MPIDFTQCLVNPMTGEKMTEATVLKGEKTTVDMTLSRVVCSALLGTITGETATDPNEHVRRFLLAERIKDNAGAVVSAEEVALAKSRVARAFQNAMIAGQACAMLDPDAVAAISRGEQPKAPHKPDKAAA